LTNAAWCCIILTTHIAENRAVEKENAFGRFFKQKRRELGLSLRAFCRENGLDPGNLSKLERGVLAPPEGREKLEAYAAMLGLEEGTDAWFEFFDLAAAARGRIPDRLLKEERVVRALPILYRTLRKDKPDRDEVERLMDLIRGAWQGDRPAD
jgi:transcriptional regulator with XRE-family HTH domain